jgi:hypothetical protein
MDVQPVADNNSAKADEAIMGLTADRFIASFSSVSAANGRCDRQAALLLDSRFLIDIDPPSSFALVVDFPRQTPRTAGQSH